MFQRLKNLYKIWILSGKDQRFIDRLEKFEVAEIQKLPNRGNGKAVFLADTAEAEERWRDEKSGWADFTDKVHRAAGLKK